MNSVPLRPLSESLGTREFCDPPRRPACMLFLMSSSLSGGRRLHQFSRVAKWGPLVSLGRVLSGADRGLWRKKGLERGLFQGCSRGGPKGGSHVAALQPPNIWGDTEVARGRSVGSPAAARVQPEACALKAAHFPLSPWDQLQRPAKECKAGGGTGARVWMMSLPFWPPVCLIPGVRGPPSAAAALGKPPIPHRSFSRALHSLSPPQTWAGSQAAFSPQRSTPGRGSRPPGGHGTDLLSGYISTSAAGSAQGKSY